MRIGARRLLQQLKTKVVFSICIQVRREYYDIYLREPVLI